jgi:hypothetical protein
MAEGTLGALTCLLGLESFYYHANLYKDKKPLLRVQVLNMEEKTCYKTCLKLSKVKRESSRSPALIINL